MSVKSKQEHQLATKEAGGNLGTMAQPHHSHTREARLGLLSNILKDKKGQAGNTSQLTAYSKEPGLLG